MFFEVYVLELLCFETLAFRKYKFSDAMLRDINVVLCYVLSQYALYVVSLMLYVLYNTCQVLVRLLGLLLHELDATSERCHITLHLLQVLLLHLH
jgi:hypothetical protein